MTKSTKERLNLQPLVELNTLFDDLKILIPDQAINPNTSPTYVKSCSYIFLASFGSVRTLVEGFVFFKSLCDLIPGISGPLSYIISAICAALNLIF